MIIYFVNLILKYFSGTSSSVVFKKPKIQLQDLLNVVPKKPEETKTEAKPDVSIVPDKSVFEELEESGKRLEKAKSLMKESHACKKEVEVRIADIEAAERDLGEKRGKKYEAERLLIVSEHERNVAQLNEDHTFRTESMRKECAKKIVALSTELDQSTKHE